MPPEISLLPAKERDELDILGKAFDLAVSPEGKVMVPNPARLYGGKKEITAFQKFINSKEMGGSTPISSPLFSKGGDYYEKVAARLANADDPADTADKLVNLLRANADPEHNVSDQGLLGQSDAALAKFKTAIAAAGTPEAKRKAIEDFCDTYSDHVVKNMIVGLQNGELFATTASLKPPASFASAIMGVLFVNSDAVEEMMDANFSDGEKATLKSDILGIATKELGVSKASLVSSGLGSFFGIGSGPDPEEIVKKAIIDDAKKNAGDNSYQVDIGV